MKELQILGFVFVYCQFILAEFVPESINVVHLYIVPQFTFVWIFPVIDPLCQLLHPYKQCLDHYQTFTIFYTLGTYFYSRQDKAVWRDFFTQCARNHLSNIKLKNTICSFDERNFNDELWSVYTFWYFKTIGSNLAACPCS